MDPKYLLDRKESIERQWELFEKVWIERGPYSEVSGERIWGDCKTIYCHHIVPKSICEEGKYDPENIIILTWAEHECVENNPVKYPEINKRREVLNKKYGII